MTPNNTRPLLVFADDWGRHPSSCQHLIRQLLDHRQVLWVNTIGTRPPRLDWSTGRRVLGKLKEWAKPNAILPISDAQKANLGSHEHNPTILAPKMWPSFRSRLARNLNQTLLLRALRPALEQLPQPPSVVTTLPLVADLVGQLPVHRWVYYCVDDFSVWPGYDGDTMLRMERELVPQMDEIIAVSDTLVSHVQSFGRQARLLTHGVDLDHWRKMNAMMIPGELEGLSWPIVLFWGVIDRRMDLAFLRRLSETMTEGSIVLVGPQEDPEPELQKLPRVKLLPPVSYDRLPALASSAAVLMMPYADLPVTRAMQPLKMKEYLATGKPVVVRSLPSTQAWGDCLDVVTDADSFAEHVQLRLREGVPAEQQSQRHRLESEGWEEKAKRFERWIDGETP